MRLADRTQAIAPFHVMELAKRAVAMEQRGHPVIHLSIGEPDFTAPPGVIAALERNKKFLRGEVSRKINLKFAPELRFRMDESFENAAKIDALLNSPKVRGDLDDPS
jgi:ribosome-binding factor A